VDFALFFTVLWRSKWFVLGGLALASVLAVLAYGKPSFANGPTLTPRKAEVWQSESQVLLSQSGFPYGQGLNPPQTSLAQLSPVYATLANGNIVKAEIHRAAPGPGTVKASEAVDVATSTSLPFVTLTTTAPTSTQAKRLADAAGSVFQAYVSRHQVREKIPPSERVQVSIVESGVNTKVIEGHKLTLPVLVFLAVLIATISIAFMRENVRNRQTSELRSVPADGHGSSSQELHPSAPAGAEREYDVGGSEALVYRDPVETTAHRR